MFRVCSAPRPAAAPHAQLRITFCAPTTIMARVYVGGLNANVEKRELEDMCARLRAALHICRVAPAAIRVLTLPSCALALPPCAR
jgi:hypothetical protein